MDVGLFPIKTHMDDMQKATCLEKCHLQANENSWIYHSKEFCKIPFKVRVVSRFGIVSEKSLSYDQCEWSVQPCT